MDNASRALIIAAEVMIGVMILAVGLYFVGKIANFGNTTVFDNKEFLRIQTYNKPFTSLINKTIHDSGIEKDESYLNKANVGDVITVLNYARHVNLQYKEGDSTIPDFVTIILNEGNINYKLDELYIKDTIKFSEKMYEILDKYSIRDVETEEKEGKTVLKSSIKPFDVTINKIERNERNMIIGMKITIK